VDNTTGSTAARARHNPAMTYGAPGGHPPGQWGQPAYQRPAQSAIVHGSAGDPRYPSPRRLRRALGFAVDFVLHLGCGVGVFLVAGRVPALARLPTVWAILAWLLVSFVHRVVIQRLTGTTLGKAIFGLCLVRGEDGLRPRFGQLLKAWLVGIVAGVSLVGAIGGASGGGDGDLVEAFLPAVRRRDVRALSNQRRSSDFGGSFG
jgi:hypothetical protein